MGSSGIDTGAGEKVEKKDKKRKVKGAEEDAGDLGFEVIDGEEVGGTVKTAAQKKKEKKDRQTQKAKEERDAGKAKSVSVEKEVVKKQDSVEKADTPVPEDDIENEDEKGEDKKGKKKKGKKDKEEEE